MKKYIGLIITGLMPLLVHAQLVITSNFNVVMTGGSQAKPTSIVLTNPAPAGITYSGTGGIISENEFNQVDWNIGTNTGTYMVPFWYSGDYIPLTFQVTTAGVGAGVVKFSTYHGANYNNLSYKPSDVTNTADFGKADYSIDMVDRFWDIDALTGYATKPTATMTFTYIRAGLPNEIAVPNYIVESTLLAQRFNTTLSKWDDVMLALSTDVPGANTGTVSSGSVTPANLFRSWTLSNDSNMILGVQNPEMSSGITTWPNPAGQTLNVKFGQGHDGDATISIANVLGQELMQRGQHVSSGMILPIDISSLAAGMYFLRVSSGSSTFTSKFIKK